MEPVSRKRTCKVSPGRFIPRCHGNKIRLVVASKLTKSTPTTTCVLLVHRIYAIDLAHDATVGERSIKSKFSYESPRSIYGETSNEGKDSASTYPCRSLSRSVQENGVEGVVLVVIQITEDPSAERTAPPRSTHVQPGDVSRALIQQGERERLRKTPSSSSTTAWW